MVGFSGIFFKYLHFYFSYSFLKKQLSLIDLFLFFFPVLHVICVCSNLYYSFLLQTLAFVGSSFPSCLKCKANLSLEDLSFLMEALHSINMSLQVLVFLHLISATCHFYFLVSQDSF